MDYQVIHGQPVRVHSAFRGSLLILRVSVVNISR